jgi:1-phosphofructokinase family hexose kinase
MIVTVTPNPSLDRTLTVPRISFDEMIRASGSRLDWGGKGFNVSRALQALGTGSVATGFLGGATGQMLAGGLRELGIAADPLPIASETRTNTVIVETETGRYIKVNEPGPTVRPEELSAFLQKVRARIQPGDVWVLSGSLPPGLPTDFYAQLVSLVQDGGARALLDASGEPLRLGCAAGPCLVKPNALEAEELAGHPIQSARCASSCGSGSRWWPCRWAPRACCWPGDRRPCGPGRPASGRPIRSARAMRC